MRKSFVKNSIALAALVAASPLVLAQQAATSSVQLYGIVDVGMRHSNNEGPAGNPGASSLTQMIGGGMSQSRWGINVREDLGGGMLVLANLENRFLADSGTAVSPYFQQSWVGLQGGFGRITVGRQFNVLFDLVTSTYASYPYSPYMDAYKPEIGFSLGARNDNMIKYTAEFGPVRGALQYSFDEKAPTGGKSIGGYVRYATGGLAAGGGYQAYEFASGKKVKAATIGASYRLDSWYFNLGYGENKVDSGLTPVDRAVLGAMWTGGANGGFSGPAFLAADKRSIYKFGVGYQVTPQINIGTHYYRAKQTGVNLTADAKADFITAAVDYAFSKRTDAYVEVDYTKLKGNYVSLNNSAGVTNGAKSRTGFTVGVRHRF